MRLIDIRRAWVVALMLWAGGVGAPQTMAEGKQRPMADTKVDLLQSKYVLGPEDQISIWALGMPEISEKPFRIDPSGYIDLPMVGRMKAKGLTADEFKVELSTQLKRYVQDPQVAVGITEFRSQPVSVIGAVRNPGVHQVQGRRTLVEVLSVAGGLQPDAGQTAKITRRLEAGRVPLPGAADDSTGKFSVAEIPLKGIIEATNPEHNILIQPHDVVSVPSAELVYVMGEVAKPGGFPLNNAETFSVLQALSLAGGVTRVAAPKKARILRLTSGKMRQEIPLDLTKMLAGKSGDVSVQPEDIVFVPNNTAKNVSIRAIETAVQLGMGIVIWRR